MSLGTLLLWPSAYQAFCISYERYAWIFITIIYIMMYALGGARGYQLDLQAATEDTGRPFAGDFLSFMGIIYSSAAGWAPVAADFNVRLPADTKPSKVFWLTFAGLMLPLLFVEIMGAALMCVPDYVAAFQEGDASGVIAEVFAPWKGGGQFLLVVLAFSVIANNGELQRFSSTPRSLTAFSSSQHLLGRLVHPGSSPVASKGSSCHLDHRGRRRLHARWRVRSRAF